MEIKLGTNFYHEITSHENFTSEFSEFWILIEKIEIT